MPTTSIQNPYDDGVHTLFVKDGPHILDAVDTLGPAYVSITERPDHDPLDGDHVDDENDITVHTVEAFQGLLSALIAHGTDAFGQEAVAQAVADAGLEVKVASSFDDYLEELRKLSEAAQRRLGVDAVAEEREFKVEEPEFDIIVTPPPVVNVHNSLTIINES